MEIEAERQARPQQPVYLVTPPRNTCCAFRLAASRTCPSACPLRLVDRISLSKEMEKNQVRWPAPRTKRRNWFVLSAGLFSTRPVRPPPYPSVIHQHHESRPPSPGPDSRPWTPPPAIRSPPSPPPKKKKPSSSRHGDGLHYQVAPLNCVMLSGPFSRCVWGGVTLGLHIAFGTPHRVQVMATTMTPQQTLELYERVLARLAPRALRDGCDDVVHDEVR